MPENEKFQRITNLLFLFNNCRLEYFEKSVIQFVNIKLKAILFTDFNVIEVLQVL